MFGAGEIARTYEALGGSVSWIGKPFRAIYDAALAALDHPAPERTLCIGDSLAHDIAGGQGVGAVNVSSSPAAFRSTRTARSSPTSSPRPSSGDKPRAEKPTPARQILGGHRPPGRSARGEGQERLPGMRDDRTITRAPVLHARGEIDHVVVEEADAARRDGAADRGRDVSSRAGGRACRARPGRDRAHGAPSALSRPGG